MNDASPTDDSAPDIPAFGTPEFDQLIDSATESLNRTEEMWSSAGFDDREKAASARQSLDKECHSEYDFVIECEKRSMQREREAAISKAGLSEPEPEPVVTKPKKTRRKRISI